MTREDARAILEALANVPGGHRVSVAGLGEIMRCLGVADAFELDVCELGYDQQGRAVLRSPSFHVPPRWAHTQCAATMFGVHACTTNMPRRWMRFALGQQRARARCQEVRRFAARLLSGDFARPCS